MPETIPAEPPRHQSGGLAVALAKLDLDAITVADAVADVASMAGENVTTTIRADFKELQADFKALRTDVNARIDTLASEMNVRIGTLASETDARFAETNARIDGLDASLNGRIDTLAGAVQSLQREIGTLRWMIGSGFTLLGLLVVVATFVATFVLRNGG